MRRFSHLLFILYSLLLIASFCGCATVSKIPATNISPALEDQTVKINNINYVPILIIANRFDYKWSWDTVARKLDIHNKALYARFLEDSNVVLLNDKPQSMEAPAILYNGALMVPVSFVQSKMLPVEARIPAYPGKKPKSTAAGKYILNKIVIDAGHGGKDPGAIGRLGLREKTVTIDIAKRLKELLEEAGFDVRLTRTDDRFVELSKRTQIANEENADIFVSIHVNASKLKNARGFEVYYLAEAADDAAKRLAQQENASLKFEKASYSVNSSNSLEGILWDMVSDENRTESIQLADHISKEARRHLWVHQRGIKSAKFYVLKGTRIPAILIEIGFISNRDEENKLKSAQYRQAVTKAIADGILAWREDYQATEGFTK